MCTKSENLIFLLTIGVHLRRARPILVRRPAGEDFIFLEWPAQDSVACGTACAHKGGFRSSRE
jgi:hypothetical protein